MGAALELAQDALVPARKEIAERMFGRATAVRAPTVAPTSIINAEAQENAGARRQRDAEERNERRRKGEAGDRKESWRGEAH
jgi:hypothetical protein